MSDPIDMEFKRLRDRIEELEDTATADQALLEWHLENAKAALGKAQLQADRIEELEAEVLILKADVKAEWKKGYTLGLDDGFSQ